MTLAVDDPEASAEEAGLRYVNDDGPGIRRRRRGTGFSYIGPDGQRLTDAGRIAWITGLAIPPAWTDVWISPIKRGHLQATGRDARGRKQYRYHPRWREVRDSAKYDRLLDFARALPKIRRRTDRDLRRRGLPREKVLATVVRLLESTLIRIGNQEYLRDNRSVGLSTMRDRHVDVVGSKLRFEFRGKSGKRHTVAVTDRRLARAVKQCQELPGQELFQYIDANGERQQVDSADVNDYLRDITGDEFSAKDFRTWAGTVAALLELREVELLDPDASTKHNLTEAIRRVAERLGNTPAVCRRCYVHPGVIDAYLDGDLAATLEAAASKRLSSRPHALRAEEAAVLGLLKARLARLARERRKRVAA
ncbi:MAG: DNA topoisomerase IB [Chloroflexota bacterium]